MRDVGGREKVGDRSRPCHDPEEATGLGGIAAQGTEHPEHVRAWRGKPGKIRGQFIDRSGGRVAAAVGALRTQVDCLLRPRQMMAELGRAVSGNFCCAPSLRSGYSSAAYLNFLSVRGNLL
jgi:hypothetical protein